MVSLSTRGLLRSRVCRCRRGCGTSGDESSTGRSRIAVLGAGDILLNGESAALLAGDTDGREAGTGGGGIIAVDLDCTKVGLAGRLGPA